MDFQTIEGMIKHSYIPKGITYLDTARDGLLSQGNFSKITQIREQTFANITAVRDEFIVGGIDSVRDRAAQFLNCSSNEVCLVNSFSAGFNFLLPSLAPWKRVMTLDNEYPSLYMPLGLRDFEVHNVLPDEKLMFTAERIISEAEAFHPDIIALSHVQYTTGFMADLKAIGNYCNNNDIILIVDATQSFGCTPLNMSELHIDVLAASTYKWMCAGLGAGVLYVSEKLQEKIKIKVGYYGAFMEFGQDWKTKQNLKNFEAGHKDHDAFYRLKFALEDALEKDMSAVLEHNRGLILKLKSMLVSAGYEVISDFPDENLAGILVIKEDLDLLKRLAEKNITVTHRAGTIRLSCHFYNDEKDLETLNSLL